MLQQTVNLINLPKWEILRKSEVFKEQQIELFLCSIHSNFNYWFNIYLDCISENSNFKIRKNTIYGVWEISCDKFSYGKFYDLEELQLNLKNTNNKIANIPIGSSIEYLGIDRAFYKIMNEKLKDFLIQKQFTSDYD